MGRRAASVQDPSRWVFNRLAGDYRRRPPYPDALVDRLAELGGGRGTRVADLGAGVGHLAIPLAARGFEVAAVEPAGAMRRALVAAAGGLPVRVVAAAAEQTGLEAASFGLVLVADALHWLDPELAGLESGRLLAPAGTLAVVEAAPAATPFMDGLGALLARASPRRPPPPGRLRQLFSLAGAGGGGSPEGVEPHRQSAALDGEGLEALLRSLSQIGPALSPRALDGLLGEARDLAARCGGARWERVLTLTWARRRPA